MFLYRWYRFEVQRGLNRGMTLREARIAALAFVREPAPF